MKHKLALIPGQEAPSLYSPLPALLQEPLLTPPREWHPVCRGEQVIFGVGLSVIIMAIPALGPWDAQPSGW